MNWKSFTEFFEGEGAVSCRAHKRKTRNYVLALSIVIGQKWEPKLKQLNDFLAFEGITSRIYTEREGHSLRIFEINSVRALLQGIEPYSFLKQVQVTSALSYLADEITANELLTILSLEHARGKRRRAPPPLTSPTRGLKVCSWRADCPLGARTASLRRPVGASMPCLARQKARRSPVSSGRRASSGGRTSSRSCACRDRRTGARGSSS